jgi:Domain of unknown function (DUF5666)/CarboxypepD_reg-like domain
MNPLRLRAVSLIVGALILATACGSGNPSPAAPSPTESNTQAPGPTPSSIGATVSGTVTDGASGPARVYALGQALSAGLPGVTVSVEGTDLSTTTGTGGAFELRGVPAGRVRLRFQGSGASGTLELNDVSQTEEIALSVVVNGSTVELESQERVTGSQAQLEGKVVSVNYAAGSLVAGTTTVMVPEGIPITNGNRALELQDVIVGARIHVKGSRAGDTITATSIMVQQTGLERVTLTGAVSELGGACPEATFKFGSQVIAVNASTIFVQGACSDLAGGETVEVKGFRRTDGSVLATMVKFKSNGGDDGAGKSVELSGVISELSGSCPARSFHIGDREVRTTGATNFLTPCATLANGQNVNVKGKATGNGKVNASQVQ